MIGMLIGYMIAGFFLSQAYAAFLYALIGVQVGFSAIARVPDAAGSTPAHAPPRPWALHRAPRPGAAPLPVR
jgi:hypothetical protein